MKDSAAAVTRQQLEGELKQLPSLIKKSFRTWSQGARPFQLKAMSAQVLGVDVLLHAATGAGKTGIAAGPHLLPSCKGKVTIMISPLLALQEEQVTTFDKEFGLAAVAVNSSNGFPAKSLLTNIVAGKYRIVILSPEMLLSRRFIENVLRRPGFSSRVLSIFIDEAHCISHWGDSFRKKYGSIGIVRAFLPKTVPIIAVSATLVPRVRKDIISKLQFDTHLYDFINVGNDRPNVAQIVRAAEYPLNSYRDLEFMVPTVMESPNDILKGFIYCDEIKAGNNITDYLNARVPLQYHNWGMVRPYNAAMSSEYRAQALLLFRAGVIRILVCTDAAGMGCNIPDIKVVVQWKLPATLSSWVQRMGRAARAIEFGTAVLIVERSAFDVDTSSVNGQGSGRQEAHTAPRNGYRKQGSMGRKPQGTSSKARQLGSSMALRGSHSGVHDSVVQSFETASVHDSSPAEGLYEYIQTSSCRRRLLCFIFGNELPTVPSDECCDTCNPLLFARVRPPTPLKSSRKSAVKKGPLNHTLFAKLIQWRTTMKEKYYPRQPFGSTGLLSNDICERLASLHARPSSQQLDQLLRPSWSHYTKLADELMSFFTSAWPVSLPQAAPSSTMLTVETNQVLQSHTSAVAASAQIQPMSSVHTTPFFNSPTDITQQTSSQFPVLPPLYNPYVRQDTITDGVQGSNVPLQVPQTGRHPAVQASWPVSSVPYLQAYPATTSNYAQLAPMQFPAPTLSYYRPYHTQPSPFTARPLSFAMPPPGYATPVTTSPVPMYPTVASSGTKRGHEHELEQDSRPTDKRRRRCD